MGQVQVERTRARTAREDVAVDADVRVDRADLDALLDDTDDVLDEIDELLDDLDAQDALENQLRGLCPCGRGPDECSLATGVTYGAQL